MVNDAWVIGVGHEALKITFYIAGPILLIAMSVGIVVSLVQAVTQINEATLSFIPKLLAITLVLVLGGPWMLQTMAHYTTDLITSLPNVTR